MPQTRTRAATLADLPRLTEIYNHYVRETPITFDIEEWTVERRRAAWFDHYHDRGRHRLLVAEEDGAPVGYATSSRFRDKEAYDTTVEVSVYLAPEATGRGVGRALYDDLFARLRDQDVHRFLAGITLPNPASVALHERFGFAKVALFSECGRKFGRYWDVVWFEKSAEEA